MSLFSLEISSASYILKSFFRTLSVLKIYSCFEGFVTIRMMSYALSYTTEIKFDVSFPQGSLFICFHLNLEVVFHKHIFEIGI